MPDTTRGKPRVRKIDGWWIVRLDRPRTITGFASWRRAIAEANHWSNELHGGRRTDVHAATDTPEEP